MSIHLDGLNPDIRDDIIEFPADVNGKRIRCTIGHAVLQRLNLKTGDHDLSSLFKQNWSRIREVTYLKIQRDGRNPDANGRVILEATDFDDG
jgi:hypothetical protein